MRLRTISAFAGTVLAFTLAVAPVTAFANDAQVEQSAMDDTASALVEVVEPTSDTPEASDALGITTDEQPTVTEPAVTEETLGEQQVDETDTNPTEGDAEESEPTATAGESSEFVVSSDEAVATEVSEPEGDSQESEVTRETEVAGNTGALEPTTQTETAASVTPVAAKTVTAATNVTAQADPKSAAQNKLDQLAKDHAKDLPAGRYAITSNADPKVDGDKSKYSLDVQGGSKNAGAQIILYKAKVSNNQRWDVAILESGYATIKSVASGLYLSLSNGAKAFSGSASPTVVQQAYKPGAAWQEWVIVKQSDGTFKLISGLLKNGTTQCAFDVKGGLAQNSAKTIAYPNKTSGGDENQKFTFSVTTDILDAEAKEHRNDLSEDTYIMTSSLNNSYKLNMQKASKDDGASALLYAGTTALNEGWDIKIDQKSGYVTIVNAKSGKVLEVSGDKAKSGAKVVQWAEKSNQRGQQWIAVRESNGSYKFVSALTGDVRYVLSVHSGKATNGTISIKADKGAASKDQHWNLKEAPEQYAYARIIEDGTYLIRTALDMTKVLDVARSSKDNGAQVKLWTAKRSANQYWILSHDNQGYVLLKNKNSGKYLAFSSTKVDGAYQLVQATKVTPWIAEPANSGNYSLIDPKMKKVADVSRNKTANGSKVIAYKQTANTNQMWVIGKDMLIAIDPGHGAGDSGAVGNGLRECDLNWRIAQACANQLRSYGFDVYMTVSQAEFKNEGGATPSLKTRIERAYKAGAKAVFSMHINASDGSAANGAEVLVPNGSSFHKEFYAMGQSFTKDVLARIKSATGIANRGAYVRNYSADETGGENQYYSGGGYADYYGIVRYARLRGLFGVIIEHGFITNPRDAQIINASATKLGQVDAAAIRNLYK